MLLGMILFCAGAWCLQQQAQLPAMSGTLLLMAGFLGRMMAGPSRRRGRGFVDIALWSIAGFYWAAFIAHGDLSRQLPSHWEGVDIKLEGVVAQLPQRSIDAQRFAFDVERVLTPQAPALSHLQLSWYAKDSVLPRPVRAGERWRFTVRLKRPHGTLNPHGFDRRFWCLEQGIQALGYIHERAPADNLSDLDMRPAYVIERWREVLRTRIELAAGSDGAGAVMVALAVGDQGAIARSDWQLFAATGVSHLMSISGLHITMLSALGGWLAARAWRRHPALVRRLPARKLGLLVGMLVGWDYALLAGLGVPALRTVIMLSVAVAILWGAYRWSATRVLATAAFSVVLLDPYAVVAAGFWLSFGAVGLLIYVGGSRLRTGAWFTQWVRSQWAMTLGLLPLLLVLFQQFSVLSPLANAFAIPLVSLVVVPLTLAGVALPGDTLLLLAHQVSSFCLVLLRVLESWPVAVWEQSRPPDWTIAVAVVGAIWALAPRGFPGRALGLAAMLPMFAAAAPAPSRGESWLDVMDVGQGLAVLVRTHRHALLFDTGPSYGPDSDAGQRIVVPHLRAQGVRHLDVLMISHDDNDHVGGARAVLQNVSVGQMSSSLPAGHTLHALARQSVACGQGQKWRWDDVEFQLLSPALTAQSAGARKDNDRSCVLRIVTGARAVLIPGDIEAPAERHLVANEADALKADVLLAPHHGSGTSSTPAFLAAVAPEYVIVSSGYGNRYGHPKEEVLQRYHAARARVMRADQLGAITVRSDGNDLIVRGWRDLHRRYWYD